MFKKLFLLLVLISSILATGFSADLVVTQCPVTTQNDTTYILDPTFNVNSDPCFDFTNTQNVIVDGNNTDFRGSGYLNILVGGDAVLGKVQNLIWDDIRITFSGTGNGFTLQDSFIEDGHHFLYTGIGSGIPNTNGADSIFYFSGSQPTTGSVQNTISILRNKFYSDGGLFPGQRDNYNLFHIPSSSGQYYDISFDIEENDFIGFGMVGRPLQNTGGDIGSSRIRPAFWDLSDNIYLRSNSIMLYVLVDDANYVCGNFGINAGNLLSSEAAIDLPNANGISDNTITITSSACTLLNTNIRTTKILNNQQFVEDKQEIATMTPLFFGANVLYDNSRYWLGKEIILNSSQQWSFSSVQNSILDLSLFNNRVAMNLEVPRSILMGNNNKIEGDVSSLPIIETQGTISVVDVGFFGNNWHLIEYDNALEISGINFDLNAIDNYGLIRKRNTGVDGINFDFNNNILDLNFVPSSPSRPLILFGSFANIDNNQFDLLGTTNVSLFGSGVSSGVAGGHVIVDNTFNGGGFIFEDLTDVISGTNFKSKFIHNEFRQVGSLYAQPFNPLNNAFNTLDDPQLNGSYFYETTCTNYEFNVGNYYEDWDDSSFYNDSNADGIHDEFNGIDYIERGQDFEGDPIRDYRSVIPYPFNFAGQTGNAISTTDTCASFVYNINSPIVNNNYTAGTDLVTDWEFISIGFPTMTCFESINGFTTIYENVGTGDNEGVEYETTDGAGTFNVKCCDNAQCDNFVQESGPIEFCIGDCNLGALVVTGATTPSGVILGCTDDTATNYNPAATQDDGSCIGGTGGTGGTGGVVSQGAFSGITGGDVLDPNDVSGSTNAVIEVGGDLAAFFLNILVPLTIFIAIIGGIILGVRLIS